MKKGLRRKNKRPPFFFSQKIWQDKSLDEKRIATKPLSSPPVPLPPGNGRISPLMKKGLRPEADGFLVGLADSVCSAIYTKACMEKVLNLLVRQGLFDEHPFFV